MCIALRKYPNTVFCSPVEARYIPLDVLIELREIVFLGAILKQQDFLTLITISSRSSSCSQIFNNLYKLTTALFYPRGILLRPNLARRWLLWLRGYRSLLRYETGPLTERVNVASRRRLILHSSSRQSSRRHRHRSLAPRSMIG